MERRTFIKNGSLLGCAMSLPFQAFLSSFGLSEQTGFDPEGEFSLIKLEGLLNDYKYPSKSGFNPDAYQFTYSAVSLGYIHVKGHLSFSRMINEGIINYGFLYHRFIPKDFNYSIQGKVQATNAEFPTVTGWEGRSMTSYSESEKPWLNTDLNVKGIVKGSKATITENGKQRKIPVINTNLSWKWGIIDLAGMMALKNINSREFSTLDEMDTIYGFQRLRYRKNKTLTSSEGEKVNFKVFDLTGDGVIPAVYWVDDHGRVVFVITGREAFMLMTSA